jgi:type I restriction enzyme S subunit
MNQGRNISRTKETITQKAIGEAGCRQVRTGTVLLSFKLTIGKVGIAQMPLYTNEAIAALPILDPDRLDALYLAWALQTVDLTKDTDKAAKGLTLNKAKLVGIPIPVPPIGEQRRIAAILDKADNLRTARRIFADKLDTLTLSLFAEEVGDPALNPKGWKMVKLHEVALQVTDGEHQTPRRTTEGTKLLSARNVKDGFLDFSEVDYIDQEEYERVSRRCNPQKGDVLISCSGTIGRSATVETSEPLALVRSVALVRPASDKVIGKFLELYLRTPFLKAIMLRRANASSQANLFQNQIRNLPVALPPLALQMRVLEKLAAIGRLKQMNQRSAEHCDALYASLQDRAFTGEGWS